MDDEQIQLETMKVLISREVHKPLVWARLKSGYYIQDLQTKRFNIALNLLEDYFFRDEVLCRSSHIIKDKPSMTGYLERLRYWMGDQLSLECLCDVKEDLSHDLISAKNKKTEQKPVGIIICKICSLLEHTRSYSRIKLSTTGTALDKIMAMRWHVHREANIFERYNIDNYLRIYALAVHPLHRCHGIGMGLLNCAVKLAKLLKISYIGGVFTDGRSQYLANKIGLETVCETQYSQWIDETGENLVFDDPGANNYTAAMMIGEVNRNILKEDEESVEQRSIEYNIPEIQSWYMSYQGP